MSLKEKRKKTALIIITNDAEKYHSKFITY